MSCILTLIFSLSALILSFITAQHMLNIHGAGFLQSKREELWHDYILNFLGCALGWLSVYYLVSHHLGQKLEITDLILILVAYMGITGYLPHIIINKSFKP